jgi:hypothetical protein
MTNKEKLRLQLLMATGHYTKMGKLGGDTNKKSGHISKLGKKNGALNGKTKNSRKASSKTGKIWGSINIKKITKEQKSEGGKIGGKIRASQNEFKIHLKDITKKSVENRIKRKIEKYKSILKFIRKKQFTYSDVRNACIKYGILETKVSCLAKSILKEKTLIKQIHKGPNQYNPSIYIKK